MGPPAPPSSSLTMTTNWLSFSMNPLEMLSSSSPAASASNSNADHQFLLTPPTFDPTPLAHPPPHYFYNKGWENPKHHFLFTELGAVEEDDHVHENKQSAQLQSSAVFTNSSVVAPMYPKLEDFLNSSSSSSPVHHPTAATHQDDSSLTDIYDFRYIAAAAAATGGFPATVALSVTSKSEVDESSNANSSFLTNNGSLTLGVRDCTQDENSKAMIIAGGGGVGPGKRTGGSFGQRTSIYRGVTRHRWTGRYEAHLWDNSCRREGQARKGRQVYLGAYDREDKAARAYDLAALKYWGPTATNNLPVSTYTRELEEMKLVTEQEFIASLRRIDIDRGFYISVLLSYMRRGSGEQIMFLLFYRKSSGFSRGASIYRGVTRHHQQGRWQARIGRVAGNKDLYLGTFAIEEEAAEAYDIAAIKFRGLNAVTNFEMSRYDMEAIARNSLPVGGAAKRLKLEPDLRPSIRPSITAEQLSQAGIISCGGCNTGLSLIQPFSAMIPSRMPYETSPSIYHQSFFHHPQQSSNSRYHSDTISAQEADVFLGPHQSY